jgi:hypothetical protein
LSESETHRNAGYGDDAEQREAGHDRRHLVEAAAKQPNHEARNQRPEAGDNTAEPAIGSCRRPG